ncbi:MAG: DUF563 domain-containing protein [Silvibacterium sp.]|nr:DUF563 domain-containing protein [Silvibacterium sp.]
MRPYDPDCAPPSLHSGHNVWIRRGKTGKSRPLLNTGQVEEYLQSQGFFIVVPESLSPPEIVRQLLRARVVLVIEGSHMVHGFYTLLKEAPSASYSLLIASTTCSRTTLTDWT